jgi:hypothetical protein
MQLTHMLVNKSDDDLLKYIQAQSELQILMLFKCLLAAKDELDNLSSYVAYVAEKNPNASITVAMQLYPTVPRMYESYSCAHAAASQ